MRLVGSQLSPKKFGDQGEAAARRLLESKGYRFLTGNFRTKFGEIDLIFQDRDELVFVEVKARTKSEQGLPEEAVNRYKLATIERVAEFFMREHPQLPQLGRIDVVAIEEDTGQVRHLVNVTG